MTNKQFAEKLKYVLNEKIVLPVVDGETMISLETVNTEIDRLAQDEVLEVLDEIESYLPVFGGWFKEENGKRYLSQDGLLIFLQQLRDKRKGEV